MKEIFLIFIANYSSQNRLNSFHYPIEIQFEISLVQCARKEKNSNFSLEKTVFVSDRLCVSFFQERGTYYGGWAQIQFGGTQLRMAPSSVLVCVATGFRAHWNHNAPLLQISQSGHLNLLPEK